jgi:hypothetical protein
VDYNLILFYFFGALASVGFIASNYVLKRPHILLLQTLGSISVSAQFAIVEIWGVALVNSIFILRNIVSYSRESYLLKRGNALPIIERRLAGSAFLALLLVVYLGVNGFVSPFSSANAEYLIWLLPLLAGVFNIVAIAQSKVINLKFYILVSVSIWATFDILTSAWTTLVGDTFSMAACLVAIVRLRRNKA